MKAFSRLSFLALALVALSLQSCIKDSCEREVTYIKAIPVYLQASDIRIDNSAETARPLENPGKIYLYDNIIYINERYEGIHIIDNTDPENPQNLTFLPIPGNVDIAAVDGTLYADSYMDLLAFDISDPLQPVLQKREKDVLPHGSQNEEGAYLVRYNFEEVTETVNCEDDSWRMNAFSIRGETDFVNTTLNPGVVSGSRASSGAAGSMSRFAIYANYLYTLQTDHLALFNISNPASPSFDSEVPLQQWWAAETLFPYEDKLFIGTQGGMMIYDNSNPRQPVFLSSISHATACDPVIVKDDYAYVTLRNGTECNGWVNQLDLVDISNINNPQIVRSFAMSNPHGLSIFNDRLFLCEGNFGLKAFDVSDPLELNSHQLGHLQNFDAFDVIAYRNSSQHLLLVIGKDGLYQFNFDDPSELKELSFIPVGG